MDRNRIRVFLGFSFFLALHSGNEDVKMREM